MSEYVKSTNFASKDSLSSGNPLKIVKGTEIDTELNNIATAVATKADLNSPTFIGTPAAPTASAGTNTTQVATTAFVTSAVTAYDTALTVSTTQIENSAVTEAKVADNAITAAKIATGAVGTDELATDAVTQAKMANSSVGTAEIIDANVTAAKLSGAQSGSAPIFGARAWVNFDGTGTVGTNQTIRGSGNVTSVYKNSTGDYTVTFTTAMSDANYGFSIGDNYPGYGHSSQTTTMTSSQFRFQVISQSGSPVDSSIVSVSVFR